jgi:sigma-B regulation protein RsbU (phosphoserine phosphatase)
MSENISGSYSREHLELLYEASEAFNSTLDIDEVLTRILDKVILITKAERGFIMLYDEHGILEFKVARGIDKKTIENPKFEVSRSVLEVVVHSGESVLTTDALSDQLLMNNESVQNLKLRSVISVPLLAKGNVIGAIYIDNRLKVGVFKSSDLDLLNTLASSAAFALENARLFHAARERGRMEKELKLAREVQSSLIPSEMPNISGWEISGKWAPAQQVAGDFFDFVRQKNENTAIVVGDVVDKGIAAALFMSFCRSIVRAKAKDLDSPSLIVSEANKAIFRETTNGMFLTLVYAEVDSQNNSLNIVNGGHNPPLIYNSLSKRISEIAPTGMLLGVDGQAKYSQSSYSLNEEDFAIIFTDGVTDALNSEGQDFGRERLAAIFDNYNGWSALEISVSVWSELRTYMGETPQLDDITYVVIKRV